MSNIAPVITLTFHDEGFCPHHFFRRAELYREAENLTQRGMLKPQIVNFTQACRIKDDVDKQIFIIDLCEPVGEREFYPKPSLVKNCKDFLENFE